MPDNNRPNCSNESTNAYHVAKVDGTDIKLMTFSSPEEYKEYLLEESGIKSCIEYLNYALDNQRLPRNEYEHQLRHEWIPFARGFIEKWGQDRIMADIRYALNDVETNLGEEVTRFN